MFKPVIPINRRFSGSFFKVDLDINAKCIVDSALAFYRLRNSNNNKIIC